MHLMKIHEFAKGNFSPPVSSTIFLLLQHLVVKHFSKVECQVHCLSLSLTHNLVFHFL